MTDWTKTFVSKDASLREVMLTIDAATLQIAMVVDESCRLLGVITDGDIRRALLQGMTLEAKAFQVMTSRPRVASPEMRLSAIERLMQDHDLHQIPVVDADGVIVGLALYGKLLPRERIENQVFLMVGGMGTRLGELTKKTPKPLLKIGDKPILEIILDSLLSQGFYRFTLAVNYKAEMIERYFGNGHKWGADITYLREKERLGTCGALGLLEQTPREPFIVMNGDILTKVNFKRLLEFHRQRGAMATMGVREYEVQVPFGVIELEQERIARLAEKPTEKFFVNAGIYALDPECLDYIPKNVYCDMTTLFQTLLEAGQPTYSYPIRDYWLDIGRAADFQQAHADFTEHWLDEETKEQ